MSLTKDFSPSGVSRAMQLKVLTPDSRATKAVSTPALPRPSSAKAASSSSPTRPSTRTLAPESGQGDRNIARHAARHTLQQGAVDLAVPGREVVHLDQNIDVNVADTEECWFSGMATGQEWPSSMRVKDSRLAAVEIMDAAVHRQPAGGGREDLHGLPGRFDHD